MSRALAAAVGAVLLLGACGGDEETSTTIDFVPPTTSSTPSSTSTGSTHTTTDGSQGTTTQRPLGPGETVEAVLTSGDPELACRTLVTEEYVRTAYGNVQGCVAAVRSGGVADSVDVRSLQGATQGFVGVVVAHGGPFDGRLQVRLVRAPDGSLQVASLESNVPVGP
jgi:hypothetical protein